MSSACLYLNLLPLLPEQSLVVSYAAQSRPLCQDCSYVRTLTESNVRRLIQGRFGHTLPQ